MWLFSSVPYMGIVGLVVIIIIGLSYANKKLEKLNFLGLNEDDKRIIVLLFILVVISDILGKLPNSCADYIPKLPTMIMILVFLFIFVIGIVRTREKKDNKH